MTNDQRQQLQRASIGSALLSGCLAEPVDAIYLTDDIRQSFADLCAAFDLLNDRLERQREAGKQGAQFGQLGGRGKKK